MTFVKPGVYIRQLDLTDIVQAPQNFYVQSARTAPTGAKTYVVTARDSVLEWLEDQPNTVIQRHLSGVWAEISEETMTLLQLKWG